jgi:hypothetical protein
MHDYELEQLDVKIAFLHGNLDKIFIWTNQKVLLFLEKNTLSISSRKLFMP